MGAMRHSLHFISWFLASSAAVIVLIDMPYVLLEHWHMLPRQLDSPLIFLTFPIVLAWMYGGFAILMCVVICESFVVDLKTASRRIKLAAGARIGLCLMAFLCITIGNEMNLH